MNPWKQWKKGFDAWESTTADYLEAVFASPFVLTPAGTLLGAVSRARAAQQKKTAEFWASFGLSTRQDQERALHALNQIQGRLLDMEDKLAELEASRAEPPSS